jgi:hypothetical protein
MTPLEFHYFAFLGYETKVTWFAVTAYDWQHFSLSGSTRTWFVLTELKSGFLYLTNCQFFVIRCQRRRIHFQLCNFCLNYTFHTAVSFMSLALQNRDFLYERYLQLQVFLISWRVTVFDLVHSEKLVFN